MALKVSTSPLCRTMFSRSIRCRQCVLSPPNPAYVEYPGGLSQFAMARQPQINLSSENSNGSTLQHSMDTRPSEPFGNHPEGFEVSNVGVDLEQPSISQNIVTPASKGYKVGLDDEKGD